MRFLTNPSYNKNTLLKKIITWFLVFLLLYWVTDGIIFWLKYRFQPVNIAEELFGSIDFPIPPSFDLLIESTHTQLFIFGIIFLAFISLVVLTPLSSSLKSLFIFLYFSLGLLHVFSFLITAWLGRGYAFIPIVAWATFRVFQMVLLVIVFSHLSPQKRKSNKNTDKKALLKKSVLLFAFINLLFTTINFKLFTQKIGFTVESVKNYYLGNETLQIFPKTIDSVLETSGIHFIVVGLYLLALTHFISFKITRNRWHWLPGALFFTAFLDIVSGIIVLYIPSLALVKLSAFYGFEILLLLSSMVLFAEQKHWSVKV